MTGRSPQGSDNVNGWGRSMAGRAEAYRALIPNLSEEESYEWAMAEKTALDRRDDPHVPPLGDWVELDRDDRWGALGFFTIGDTIGLTIFKGWAQVDARGIQLTRAQVEKMLAHWADAVDVRAERLAEHRPE